jgi:transcriptional regulator with XRE-family HTH domain
MKEILGLSMGFEAKPAAGANETTELPIGHKLRQRRKRRGLSLQAVASASGVSIGQLSQIERDLSQPSLRSLRQICGVLDMPIGWLFEERALLTADDAGFIVRAQNRRIMDLGAKGMVKEMMTPDECSGIQMLRIVIQPGGSSGEEPYTTKPGARCCTVMAGRLGLELNQRTHVLQQGDSFAFEGTQRLMFWCEGPEPCELIWTISPAIY